MFTDNKFPHFPPPSPSSFLFPRTTNTRSCDEITLRMETDKIYRNMPMSTPQAWAGIRKETFISMNLEVEWRTDDKYRTMTAFRIYPQGPHSHIVLTGGGVPRYFFRSKFWPKEIYLSLWKTLLGSRKKKTQGFFRVLYISSVQINNTISAIYCWYGYAKI